MRACGPRIMNSVEFGFWGPLAAFAASLTWATGVLGYSKLSLKHPAYVINLHRIFVGFPAACLLLTLAGGWGEALAAIDGAKVGWAVVVVLSSYAFGDALFFMATKRLGGPAALAVASVYPLWSALWGVFCEGQMLNVGKAAGVCVIVGGVIAVILSGARGEDIAPSVPRLQPLATMPRARFWKEAKFVGYLLAFGASLSWAMNAVAVANLGQGLSASFVNVLRLGIALLLCPLIGVAMNGLSSFRLIRWPQFVSFLPVFAVESVLGPFFFVYGLSKSPLAVGAALSSLAPAISVPVAVLLGRERFSRLKTTGVFAVVVGIWLLLNA